MALIYHERIREASASTGLGNIVLDGAPDLTYKAFGSRLSDGDTTDIAIFGAGDFECCRATYNSSTNSLTRGTVYASSNADGHVSFLSGAKVVVQTLPATRGRELEALGRQGTAVASAATTNIWGTTADSVHVTGSTGPITSFGTPGRAGLFRTVIFDSTPTITRNASTLETHTGANVTVEAGDVALIYAESTSKAVILFYRRQNPITSFTDIKQAATTSVSGASQLASDAEALAKTNTAHTLTPSNLAALGSSASFAGLVALAADATAQAKASTTTALTPANLAALATSTTFQGLVELATDAEAIAKTDGTRAVTPANLAALTFNDFVSGIIKAPANQDYRIVERIPAGWTITRFSVKLAAGTCTAALKINSTQVGSCSLSATTTQATTTTTAPNTAVNGDALVVTVSSASGAVDLSVTVEFSRLLL